MKPDYLKYDGRVAEPPYETESTPTDREQFEKTMRRVYGKGMPDAEEMQWAWQGWQAARAAPAHGAGGSAQCHCTAR